VETSRVAGESSPGVQRVEGGTLFSNLTLAVRAPLSAIPERPVIPPPAPVASQPIPAPQPVPQGEWTPACDEALAALVGLKIPKRRAIDLIRRAAGSTCDEILRAALRIHGQNRTQPITGSMNGHALGASTPTQVAPASPSVQQQSQRADAIAALIGLGIASKTAVALVQQCSGNSTEDLIRQTLKSLRDRK
jgi:hypothetical protein